MVDVRLAEVNVSWNLFTDISRIVEEELQWYSKDIQSW